MFENVTKGMHLVRKFSHMFVLYSDLIFIKRALSCVLDFNI